jgi:hypothetical protein
MAVSGMGPGTGRLSEDALKALEQGSPQPSSDPTGAGPSPAAPLPQVRTAPLGTDQLRLQDNQGQNRATTLLKGAGVLATGVAGSVIFKTLKDSVSVKKKVKSIQDLTEAITNAKASGTTLGTAAMSGAGDLAARQLSGKGGQLSGISKVNAGLSIVRGVAGIADLPRALGALKDGISFKKLIDVTSDSLGGLSGADEAVKLVTNSKVGFLGAKVNPFIGMAFDGFDAVRRIGDLKHWSKLTAKDRIADFTFLGGDALDGVGSAMMLTPAAPIGLILKGVGAGISVIGLGISHIKDIEHLGAGIAHEASKVETGAQHFFKKLFSWL